MTIFSFCSEKLAKTPLSHQGSKGSVFDYEATSVPYQENVAPPTPKRSFRSWSESLLLDSRPTPAPFFERIFSAKSNLLRCRSFIRSSIVPWKNRRPSTTVDRDNLGESGHPGRTGHMLEMSLPS